MAHDEHLASRIRKALGATPGITEKRMFGGIAFLRHGLMFVGVIGHTLMARVGRAHHADSLAREHVRVMDFTGTPMAGYVFVDEPGVASDEALHFWLGRCLDFVATLPPKATARKVAKPRRKPAGPARTASGTKPTMEPRMPTLKRIQFSTVIAAPASRVYHLMTDLESYRHWTAAFAEGSTYEGSWAAGQRIRFLAPSGDGMVAEIAENRPGEFISIRHLGFVSKGIDDTTSESARAWARAYENYSFEAVPGGTRVVIDQDVTPEFEADMVEAWPRALARLKALCEQPDAG